MRSDLLTCVKPVSTEQPNPPPFYDCKIFDRAAVVYALPSTTVSTFDSSAENVFIPFMLIYLQSGKRVDIVWDTYKTNSIKDSTRDQDSSKLEHVSVGQYKQEKLFALLTSRVSNFQFPENKEVNITSDESVVTSRGSSDMQRCDHEEADTRIAVHVQRALDKGCKQAFCPNGRYGCSRHINRAFPRHDRLVFICSHLDWFGLGKIYPIHQSEFHLGFSWT